jgi:hypothetical protein
VKRREFIALLGGAQRACWRALVAAGGRELPTRDFLHWPFLRRTRSVTCPRSRACKRARSLLPVLLWNLKLIFYWRAEFRIVPLTVEIGAAGAIG